LLAFFQAGTGPLRIDVTHRDYHAPGPKHVTAGAVLKANGADLSQGPREGAAVE
jgi:hypothetical protein